MRKNIRLYACARIPDSNNGFALFNIRSQRYTAALRSKFYSVIQKDLQDLLYAALIGINIYLFFFKIYLQIKLFIFKSIFLSYNYAPYKLVYIKTVLFSGILPDSMRVKSSISLVRRLSL